MALAAYKDFCIDAVDAARLGRFWGAVLGLEVGMQDNGDAYLTGPTSQHRIWINQVPEVKAVKHRMHLDVRAESVAAIEELGATIVDSDSFPWTVMRDLEGGEFCIFTSAGPPEPGARLAAIGIDAVDHVAIAQWWADVLGGTCTTDPHGFSSVSGISGAPFDDIDFVAVPERKTVKNRLHIDVTTPDLAALVAAGASVLRVQEPPIRWTVMADPEGNEFCAFARP